MTQQKSVGCELNGLTKSGRGHRMRIIDLGWRFNECELLSRELTETAAVCDSDSTNDTFSDDASDDINDNVFEDSSTSCDSVDNTWECSDVECLQPVWP